MGRYATSDGAGNNADDVTIHWYATGLVAHDYSQEWTRRYYDGDTVEYHIRLYAAAFQNNGRWNISGLHVPRNYSVNLLIPGAVSVERSNGVVNQMSLGWETSNSAWLLVPEGGSISGGFNVNVNQGDRVNIDCRYAYRLDG